ncbi:hTAFII28-like protein conserved region-domain-containing protein [Coniella lustricola]|uniref:HTAFII28-like protein conserved region-domain-containing protein n=1 Tax=Coniella lustricola TaxID=2025994 RepID=A0A2T3A8P0_9PEZI|nr:hTAFII28-like protein conserved region-domain-containing protein [Coniella lustricola]
MSSPPYQSQSSPPAHSPPNPANAQLPNTTSSNRKRVAGDAGPAPALKRRKASVMSIASTGSAHPLRQTSFPPEESPFDARSPSVGPIDNADNVSMISGSAVSVTGGGGGGGGGGGSGRVPKKRGRKSKADKAREAAEKEGTPSVVGGRAMTVASGRSGAGGARSAIDGEGPDDDEEDEKDIKAKMGVAQFERSREEREEEKRLRFMLVQQMDADQAERYEMWHAAKLTEATVRRIVNATVSQSVPANVCKAMQSVAKVFVGDLIEASRKVQSEWVTKANEPQAEPGPQDGRPRSIHPKAKPKEPLRGALRPDHVREAWRRYKSGAEGGNVGNLGLWHKQQSSGVERFGVRTGGRRLFK